MHKIKETIVVEGRYDKNTLSQIIDAAVIETDGFGIFSDSEKINLLKKLAGKNGLIILTDSDGAGFLIRNYLKGTLSGLNVKHAYIPDIKGKEKRKRYPSSEGKLGVEGMAKDVIIAALRHADATFEDETTPEEKGHDPVTKTDMYMLGFSGRAGSLQKRRALLEKLDLPEKLSPNSLLDVLNVLYSKEEFYSLIRELFPQ